MELFTEDDTLYYGPFTARQDGGGWTAENGNGRLLLWAEELSDLEAVLDEPLTIGA